MSGKKNKKIRKTMQNRAKCASHQAADTEDHSVPPDIAAKLLRYSPRDLPNDAAPLQYDPRMQVKPISAVLLDVIDPWVQAAHESGADGADFVSYLKFLCTLATFAWGLKLIQDEAARRDGMADIVKFLDKHLCEDDAGLEMCTDTMVGMLERAEELYPRDRRRINSFEIVEEKAGPKIYVACTMHGNDVPESLRAEFGEKRTAQAALTAPRHTTACGTAPRRRIR